MKTLFKNCLTYSIIFSSFLIFSKQAKADIKLTTGKTINRGSVIYRVTFKNGEQTRISQNLAKGTGALLKAELLEGAFKNPGTLAGKEQRSVDVTLTQNMLTFKGIKSLQKLIDPTGENAKLEAINKQKPTKATFDNELIEVASSLSGLDSDGNESVFLASLGFETDTQNILVSSELLFSELGGNSIDDLLSITFTNLQTQLPIEFQPNLSLDLTNDEISFIYPENTRVGTGFLESQATDSNISSSLEITTVSVPEFYSIKSLLSFGILGMLSLLVKIANKKNFK